MTQKDKKLELDSLKVREKEEMRELNITRFQEDPSHMELEKCCGNCCWFYAEDTYGFGCCPYQFAEVKNCGDRCQLTLKYVSKKEMRHHMAVLLRMIRHKRRPDECKAPQYQHEVNALFFAYKYIEIFSEL